MVWEWKADPVQILESVDSRTDVSQATTGLIERSVSGFVEEIVASVDSSTLAVIDSTVAVVAAAVVVIERYTQLALMCSHHRPSVEVGEAPSVVASVSAVTPLASVCSAGMGLVVPQVTVSASLASGPFLLAIVRYEDYPGEVAMVDLVPWHLVISCTAVACIAVHETSCTLAVPCCSQYPIPRMDSERIRTDQFVLLLVK